MAPARAELGEELLLALLVREQAANGNGAEPMRQAELERAVGRGRSRGSDSTVARALRDIGLGPGGSGFVSRADDGGYTLTVLGRLRAQRLKREGEEDQEEVGG